MAIIGGAFSTAFQSNPLAFQTGAFQVNTALLDAAGDVATPQELAWLERRRRVQRYLDERRKRYELQRLRRLDAEIDALLAGRDGAEGERPDLERPESAREVLVGARSAVQPLKVGPAPKPGPLGNRLKATAPVVTPQQAAEAKARTAYLDRTLGAFSADQDQRRAAALAQFVNLTGIQRQARDQALSQLLALPARPKHSPAALVQFANLTGADQQVRDQVLTQLLALPTRPKLSPDQLVAALARGNAQIIQIRGY